MNRFYLPIEHLGKLAGTFDVTEMDDPIYKGIDVEFIPAIESKDMVSRPRILFEFPNEEGGKLRLLVWADPLNEDYTDCIEFNN